MRAIAAGDAVVAPSATRRLLEQVELPGTTTRDPRLQALTDREHAVLLAVARGASNTEIGAELFMAPATVKTHVGRLLAKLEARDRVQLVILAYENRLVRCDLRSRSPRDHGRTKPGLPRGEHGPTMIAPPSRWATARPTSSPSSSCRPRCGASASSWGFSMGGVEHGAPVHVTGWEAVYVLGLSVVTEGLALLTLGLVRPWGERFPRRFVLALAGFGAGLAGAAVGLRVPRLPERRRGLRRPAVQRRRTRAPHQSVPRRCSCGRRCSPR